MGDVATATHKVGDEEAQYEEVQYEEVQWTSIAFSKRLRSGASKAENKTDSVLEEIAQRSKQSGEQ